MNLDESYKTLRLEPGASLQEVKRAYYEGVKFFHPDRHQGSPGLLRRANEETKKLNLAYERICKVLNGGKQLVPRRQKRSRNDDARPAPVAGQGFMVPCCGMVMNWVAAGRFRMGSPAPEAGRSDDEGPLTEVRLSRGFWLGKFPVTQSEWKAVADEASGLNAEPSFFRGSRLPVEQVSWDDCQKWFQEMNALEDEANRLPKGFEYRLPTEAEWEFACRAGTVTRFHCGDADAMLDEFAWFSANSGGASHPVGEKKANPWGFYDMHGNVWEWCADRYGALPGGSVTDPTGPTHGLNRVFRGGAWGIAAPRCRSAYRVWNRAEYRDYSVGFRVALAARPSPQD